MQRPAANQSNVPLAYHEAGLPGPQRACPMLVGDLYTAWRPLAQSCRAAHCGPHAVGMYYVGSELFYSLWSGPCWPAVNACSRVLSHADHCITCDVDRMDKIICFIMRSSSQSPFSRKMSLAVFAALWLPTPTRILSVASIMKSSY